MSGGVFQYQYQRILWNFRCGGAFRLDRWTYPFPRGGRCSRPLAVVAVLVGIVAAGCGPDRDGTGGRQASSRSADPPSLAAATLSDTKQEYIWAIEHTAFELEKKFGKDFLAALRTKESAALEPFCLPEFSGQLVSHAEREVLSRGSLREVTLRAADEPSPSVTGSELRGALARYLQDFDQVRQLKLRVLDLHAQERQPATGEWTATILLSAAGTAADASPRELVSKHRVRLRFTSDQEIEAGRILEHWQVLSESTRSASRPLFEEVTEASGLDEVDLRDNWKLPSDQVRQYFFQMAAEDFDRDGDLDLAVASADGRWRLLRSAGGGTFQEVGPSLGIPASAHDEPRSRGVIDQAFLATWIDWDNDGFPDLVLGDRLFHNLRGERFQDISEASGLQVGYNPKGCIVADYDCDGRLDLYVLYQHPRAMEPKGPVGWVGDNASGAVNQLWKNSGQGRFENVTEASGAGGGRRQSFAAAWLFANDDRWPDLYIANDFGNNVLLVNQGDGRFRDVSPTAGVSNYANSMGVATGDLTGDGQPEIYVANMFSKMGRRIIAHVAEHDYPPGVFDQIQGSCAGNRLFTPAAEDTGPSSRYREVSETAGVNQVGWAYAPALADFDADGRLDIYATAGFLSFRRDKPDG